MTDRTTREGEMAGKTAIITGGTKGIGFAAASLVIEAGGQVVITARNVSDGEAAAAKLGDSAIFVPQDALVAESWGPVIEAALGRFGRIDGLVNNVGGSGRMGRIADISPEEFRDICDLNVRGTLLGLQKGYAAMRDNPEGGAIVNIASIAALYVQPMACGYCSSKAMLPVLARRAAKEFGPRVRVNTIYPGVISSEMAERDFAIKGNKDVFLAGVPMRRLGEFHEIGRMARFLLSDRSRGITAADFVADGGKTIL